MIFIFSTDRVKAMSDGLFAIFLTILVLDFSIPSYNSGHLALAIYRQWPTFVAYLMSFFLIGVMWLFHHDLFSHIEKMTGTLNVLNLITLFCITLINYPTSLVSATLVAGNSKDIQTAIIFYDIAAALVSSSFFVLYCYVYKHPEFGDDQVLKKFILKDPLVSVLIYIISVVFSFVSVLVGGIFLVLGILWHGVAYWHLVKRERLG